MTETFADQPLYPIAVRRPGRQLFGDRHPQSGTSQRRVGPYQDREVAVTIAPRTGENRPELSGSGQPGLARKPRVHGATSHIGAQGVSRARPLARRRASTLRPLRVAIRARKPCVRLRLMTLGWNVRFMAVVPVFVDR